MVAAVDFAGVAAGFFAAVLEVLACPVEAEALPAVVGVVGAAFLGPSFGAFFWGWAMAVAGARTEWGGFPVDFELGFTT